MPSPNDAEWGSLIAGLRIQTLDAAIHPARTGADLVSWKILTGRVDLLFSDGSKISTHRAFSLNSQNFTSKNRPLQETAGSRQGSPIKVDNLLKSNWGIYFFVLDLDQNLRILSFDTSAASARAAGSPREDSSNAWAQSRLSEESALSILV